MRTSDWQGWVEIANTDYLPLFQGKIVATAATRDYTGAHNKKLITTELKDQDLIKRLCAAMDKEVKPETCSMTVWPKCTGARC
jgi:hypothetical protein